VKVRDGFSGVVPVERAGKVERLDDGAWPIVRQLEL
jgi:hypothetical protein